MSSTRPLSWVLLSPLLAAGAIDGCAGDSTQGNGPRHFLEDCASSCSPGFECICGTCTKGCSASSDCASIAPGATCAVTFDTHHACRGAGPARACDFPCASARDCSGLADAPMCVSGYCRSGAAGGYDVDARIASDGPSGGGRSGGDGGNGGAVVGAGVGASPGGAGKSNGGRLGLAGDGGAPKATGGGPAADGGSPGSGGSGGQGSGGKAGSGGAAGGTIPTMLPTVSGTCPTLKTGSNTVTVNGTATTWTAWMGANEPSGSGGPIIIYWHSRSATAQEATTALTPAVIQEVQDAGGIVAAPEGTSGVGSETGAGVWFTGDVAYADQFIACSMQQLHIDPRHIHMVGLHVGGGIHAVYMWFARSGYIATVVTYDGGLFAFDPTTLQDPSHPPPALAAHGALGKDTAGIDFADASWKWEATVKQMNGFAIDCDDGGGTEITTRLQLAPQAWQFMKAHPYGASPEPYTTLPSGWPGYCVIK